LTDVYVRDVLRRELGGRDWQVSELMGSMGKTRLASRGPAAVAVKLVDTPLAIMTRLSEIGVTPPVIAAGEYEGARYLVQQVVTGPHPDHDWFGSNVARWADMVRCYLDDLPLRRMLEAESGFWRLGVVEAVAMFENLPIARTAALQDNAFHASLERWRRQAGDVARFPFRPIHPDAHWNNYVIADGRPYLLDWENVDLSDPIRDVGIQVWGFLPKRQWAEFLRRVDFVPTDDIEIAMYWWAAFKMLMNAFWNDEHGDEGGAGFHAHIFRTAVEQRPWVARHD
jgi:hypothetical protein